MTMNREVISDLHVHTHFSCDSNASVEDYCLRALCTGVRAICFTDHVDNNPADIGLGYYDADAFFSEFRRAQDKYGGRIRLLAGLEFSEPYLYRAEFDRYRSLPYDFIIGSVHFWHGDMYPSEMRKAGVPLETCFREYWREVRLAVQYGGFDSLGHMDLPKRYYGDAWLDDAELMEIASLMVRNNICPEINTSSLRKGVDEPMPGRRILDIYRAAGGEYVTIGSDAHAPEELAAGRGRAMALAVESGVREAVFVQRKPKIVI